MDTNKPDPEFDEPIPPLQHYVHSHDDGSELYHSHSDPTHNHSHEDADDEDDLMKQEQQHFQKVLNAFVSYQQHSHGVTQRRRNDFHALPPAHKRILPGYLKKLDEIDEAINKNFVVVKSIVSDSRIFMDEDKHGRDTSHLGDGVKIPQQRASEYDMDKLRSTLKQFVRDWAIEGKPERDAAYTPIINELLARFGSFSLEERGAIRILVPGAGLGRLAFDIAKEGFSCQGNEFSFFMLLSSHFILNRISTPFQYEIYPYIHSLSNSYSIGHTLTPIRIPDILPGGIPSTVDFSMIAGDFTEVYGHGPDNEESWDAVVTCFFIDTAHNLVEYLEIIYRVLKPGGVWINLGPLLYHYENVAGEMSIELSLEEVRELVKEVGFSIEKESIVKTTYTSNPHGMLKYQYECVFWTAIRDR